MIKFRADRLKTHLRHLSDRNLRKLGARLKAVTDVGVRCIRPLILSFVISAGPGEIIYRIRCHRRGGVDTGLDHRIPRFRKPGLDLRKGHAHRDVPACFHPSVRRGIPDRDPRTDRNRIIRVWVGNIRKLINGIHPVGRRHTVCHRTHDRNALASELCLSLRTVARIRNKRKLLLQFLNACPDTGRQAELSTVPRTRRKLCIHREAVGLVLVTFTRPLIIRTPVALRPVKNHTITNGLFDRALTRIRGGDRSGGHRRGVLRKHRIRTDLHGF